MGQTDGHVLRALNVLLELEVPLLENVSRPVVLIAERQGQQRNSPFLQGQVVSTHPVLIRQQSPLDLRLIHSVQRHDPGGANENGVSLGSVENSLVREHFFGR